MIDKRTSKLSLSKYFEVNTNEKYIFYFLSVYHSMMDSSKHDYFEYFDRVHGILMYKDFVKYWDDVEAFEARPDDLVIATYPKSGESPCYV